MLQFENKKVVLAGVVAAMLLTGCGKSAPTTAAPIAFDDEPAATAPADTSALEEAAPADELPADLGAQLPADEPATPDETADGADDEAAAEAEAKKKAEEEAAAAKKAEEEAAAKKEAEEQAARDAKAKEEAEEAAAKKAEEKKKREEEEAREKAEKLERQTPKFSKAIGEGSLHSANGLAVLDGILYVIDNARTGLFGKFAAVRSYDVATGDFQSSIENIGWMGAKNLPTTVTRVKIADGQVVAADGTTSYSYTLDGTLMGTTDATFELPTEVTTADGDDVYKIKDGHVVRYDDDGDKVCEFGEDELTEPVSIALDAKGNIYVSEKSGAKVVVFSEPED